MFCLCLFYPCSCEQGDPPINPKVPQENRPGLRKSRLSIVPKVSQDGGGQAGADRRLRVRTG